MKLTYAFCDDWFIYAHDNHGELYQVSTELWPEWCSYPKGADQEENATEKYMLPIARHAWQWLSWHKCEWSESCPHCGNTAKYIAIHDGNTGFYSCSKCGRVNNDQM